MQIRILKTVMGSEDGATTRPFEVGKVYEFGPSPRSLELAAVFLREGWAEAEAVERQAPPPVEVDAPAPREAAAPVKPAKRGRG